MSYFAKPNFIIYDKWFDDDLEKNKLNVKDKNIKNISNIREFFYEQSNYKVVASEKNLQLDIKVNEKELITNNYLEKIYKKLTSATHKKFSFIKTSSKARLNLALQKN